MRPIETIPPGKKFNSKTFYNILDKCLKLDRIELLKVVALTNYIMSCSRHCCIYKASNNKWYLELGDFEYAKYEDSTTYGPFENSEKAEEELENHSNPGALNIDDNGKNEPPVCSPNGKPIRKPVSKGWITRKW